MTDDKVDDKEKRFRAVERSKTFQNIVSSFDLRNKAVLDIGCSNGEYLIHFGKDSVGFTISHDEVACGKIKELDIRYGNIEEDKVNIKETFDVIYANNIFEHLYSPHAFLIKIKPYIKPDGLFILGVPCIPKIVFLLHFLKFRGSLAVAHINFFTKDTLVKTVERGGWKVQAVRGFRLKNGLLDRLLNLIYPHFYVIATPDPDFRYHEKRLKELEGYKKALNT